MPPLAHQSWPNGVKKLEHLGTNDPEVLSELCHHLLCHLEQLSAPSWASVSPHTYPGEVGTEPWVSSSAHEGLWSPSLM